MRDSQAPKSASLDGKELDQVVDQCAEGWEQLRNGRIFITGGTGFFGIWLLESFFRANDRLKLGASISILTRNPTTFLKNAPELACHPSASLVVGDVRDFSFPPGAFSHLIHAATAASDSLNRDDPSEMLSTIVDGTRRVLAFAEYAGVRRMLFTSSGAVYGAQPPGLSLLEETYPGAPDVTSSLSAYGEGKRVAELLCSIQSNRSSVACVIARCFAFVGPHLPLDTHFAIGNFIRDALRGLPIVVKGDGRTVRSYLYSADLV